MSVNVTLSMKFRSARLMLYFVELAATLSASGCQLISLVLCLSEVDGRNGWKRRILGCQEPAAPPTQWQASGNLTPGRHPTENRVLESQEWKLRSANPLDSRSIWRSDSW